MATPPRRSDRHPHLATPQVVFWLYSDFLAQTIQSSQETLYCERRAKWCGEQRCVWRQWGRMSLHLVVRTHCISHHIAPTIQRPSHTGTFE
eukprot:76110-Amphidinium_carterae.1